MKVINLIVPITLLFSSVTYAQDYKGPLHPPLEDVGKFKQITTTPEEATCGEKSKSTFCAPAESEEGIRNGACNGKSCNQDCPVRDRSKDTLRFINLLNGDAGSGVIPDYTDTLIQGSHSFKFRNYQKSRIIPNNVPRMGRNGQFTLSVWLKQVPRTAGVIFEKIAGPGRQKVIIFTVFLSATQITIQYRGLDRASHLKNLPVSFSGGRWHHLAIQVYGADISVFIDGNEADGTPFVTSKLEVPMVDLNDGPLLRVGQRVRGTAQYLGLMQLFHWYDKALTNREIQALVSGIFPESNIQSNCLCPEGYPRIHPLEERFCIPNGVPDTDVSRRVLRLEEDAHPLEYINDGDVTTTWVSSKKLYMPGGVTINIDLENGVYQVFYIAMEFYSPQPKAITISRMSNSTEGFVPWGYFADDCTQRFSSPPFQELTKPSSVNCRQFLPPDEIQFSNGNVTLDLLSPDRPGYLAFYNTPDLMDFVEATQIQIRFQHQYHTDEKDVDVGHLYYGLNGIRIIGRCNCHGHADSCDMDLNPYQCGCLEESHTDGTMCERCKPLYNNKKFRIGDYTSPYPCQKCDCHKHADSCHYDEGLDPEKDDFFAGGGGVCDDCKHNTAGRFCEECALEHFREVGKPLDASDVCTPCNCHMSGVLNGTIDCEKLGGQCPCKNKVTSRRCNICVDGYYNLNRDNAEGCEECNCHLPGTVNRTVTCRQKSGRCNCRENVVGRQCDKCQLEYKNLTDSNPFGCEPCNCSQIGSRQTYCNPETGQCSCKQNVQGMICDVCEDGFWGLSRSGCQPCGCDGAGTEPGTICDKVTGQCTCKAHVKGRTCNLCVDEFFNLLESNQQGCESCSCDSRGTINGSLVCDKESGQCDCKEKVHGRECSLCKGNTFGLSQSLLSGCEPCNCDPKGTALGDQQAPHELVCDANSGQCACLSSREGRRCDQCSPGFYLPASNQSGCLVCDCHPVGSLSQVCNNVTGICPCKPEETGAGLQGRRCDECAPEFWSFHALFGTCKTCDCNVAGSEHLECNAVTGQCQCKGNVVGQTCADCKPGSSHLQEDNPMGCYSHPEQQAAPTEKEVNSRWILLKWNPPDSPNGNELEFQLFRNDHLINEVNDTSPFTTYTYNDTGLLPYTDYDYFIETSNIGGSTASPILRVTTLAGIPTGVPPLQVSNVKSHQAFFEWDEPAVAHGPIETYVLQSVNSENDETVQVHYRGLQTSETVTELEAFTNYTFTLRACTSGGCGNSLSSIVITPEAKPRLQPSPTIVPVSNTSLQVTWDPPLKSNGIIHQYEVMMRGKPKADGTHSPLQRVVFRSHGSYDPRKSDVARQSPLNPPVSNFTQEDLQPFTEYEFLVSASNVLGSVESSWATMRTLEGTPVYMNPPHLDVISSSDVNITWESPDPVTQARGEVVMYQVILTRNNSIEFGPEFEDVVIYSCAPSIRFFLASGFEPYSTHTIKLKLCNSVSCVLSDEVNVTTLPAAPEIQLPPTATRQLRTIYLNWSNPEQVNGPRPQFQLLRSPVSFSKPPVEMSKGVRFPGKSFTRFPPSVLPRDASYTGVELKFRTFEADCLIFLAVSPLSSNGIRQEYIVLQLKSGRPWFLFDAQNNPTAVTTTNDNGKLYNDGNWHRFEVNRFGRDGFIEIDGNYTGKRTSDGKTTVIGVNDGVYIGGIPGDYKISRPNDRNDKVVVTNGFIGCIKDLRVQLDGSLSHWTNITWDQADMWNRTYEPWQGCPSDLKRPVAHFLGQGFLRMSKTIGELDPFVWNIKLKLRTEFLSGVLVYATGWNGDMLIATLNNGTIRYAVTTSGNTTEMEYSLNNPLCDGTWHEVALLNYRGQLQIQINGISSALGRQFVTSFSKFDLGRLLFVGGAENDQSIKIALNNENLRSFGGCMKNIIVNNDKVIDITHDVQFAMNVDLDGCPKRRRLDKSSSRSSDASGEESGDGLEDLFGPTSPPIEEENVGSCLESNVNALYKGEHYNYEDHGVNETLFTRYLYKVTSSNAGGEAQSDWMIARSGEGIPQWVPSPYDERSESGREVGVKWRRPLLGNGVVTSYVLSAVETDSFDESYLNSTSNIFLTNAIITNSTFDGDIHQGAITNLLPWTNYSILLTACNIAGCARSSGWVTILTQEETPEGVNPPTAVVTAEDMTIHWSKPQHPNGAIVNYTLRHNNTEIYTGLNTSFVITGLPIFTAQDFILEVCTLAGCNDSEQIRLYSGQLPPSHVDQPMVTVRGPHTVEVRWLSPAIMNGIFKRYILYLRNETWTFNTSGEIVYNSTERFLEHTLYDLIAGSLYHVTLACCTGGGCKLSSPTPCTTKESVPEGIPAPTVTSQSPQSFDVTWSEPSLPNGEITLYSLFQNDALVTNSTEPGDTVIAGMFPWSLNTFRVRVCTKKGCSYGPEISARTQESAPEGHVNLQVTVLGPKTLEAMWTQPSRRNGLMQYQVLCVGQFYSGPENGDYTTYRSSEVMLNTSRTDSWMRVDGLVPYSDYIVKLNASNGAGYVISNMRTISMPPGPPDGVATPHLRSLTPNSILVTWSDPARNNAPGNSLFQLEYREVFPPENEIELFDERTRQMSYDLEGLAPYKEYEFQVTASNPYGETKSGWTSIYTMQARPESMDPPIVYVRDAWALSVTWEKPSQPNGIVREYRLYESNDFLVSLNGNLTLFVSDNLEPYTTYYYRIEACTQAGCTTSDDSDLVTTSAYAPQGVEPPTLRSDSPSSVFVTWKPPKFSNGILDNYLLERRTNDTDDNQLSKPQLLGVFVPSQSLRYLDEDRSLRPYTSYQYQVISSTIGGGVTPSEWATITTRPGRPGGILAPTVQVVDSTTILVEWESPLQPNGPVINYEIAFPDPRVRINNITEIARNVSDLIPFTDYQVTITACTKGGCTESPSTLTKTLPDIPSGLDPPIATVISEHYVNVQWKPPIYPNGPGIYYELSRMILSQPLLQISPSYINITQQVYSGVGLVYEDRSLEKFTECEYRVSVFNSIGSLASDPSHVTTLAGYPLEPGKIEVATHNHTSVLLWWSPPSLMDLQGAVHMYTIHYNSSDEQEIETSFPPNTTSWKLNGLTPGSLYQFTLDVSNGAHNVTSPVVYAETDDGAPLGVYSPVVYSLSSSQLRVSWLEPRQPNGQIISYKIHLDGTVIDTDKTEPSSYVIKDLKPYTIYNLKLEACTIYACAVSNVTQATTLETNPRGIKSPDLTLVTDERLDIEWKAPVYPNGIIKGYEIRRRIMRKCVDIKVEDLTGTCTYVKCERNEKLCGSTCYHPTLQICCSGVLHKVNGEKECCGKYLVAIRGCSSDVCCGGKFHGYEENYECCSGHYLRVYGKEICCKDPIEDRISVGVGNSCCGGVPYVNNGLQICCDGQLHDGFGRQCCGGEVTSTTNQCCGNNKVGATYDFKLDYICCGSQYLPSNITTCCINQYTKETKAYLREASDSASHSKQKCCSTEMIPSDQSCCHGNGYNPTNEVCADVATMSLSDDTVPVHCGSGTLCSLEHSMFSACDRCDFDREKHDCFRSTVSPELTFYSEEDICPTSYVTIYSGPAHVFSFYDQDLFPHTRYQYIVVAENKVGQGESDPARIFTPQNSPTDVYAPDWSSENRDTITLTWKPPGQPNGVITKYVLVRDGLEIWNGLALRHTDSFNILSYREYEYVLKACTIASCGSSIPVRATSVQGVPEFVPPPRLLVTGPHIIEITWVPPPRSNGFIERYVVNDVEKEVYRTTPSDDLHYEITNLKPYSLHTYSVSACTAVGCTESDEVSIRTSEARPEGVWHKSAILVLNMTTVELFWSLPQYPNGLVTEYRIHRRYVEDLKDINDALHNSKLELIYSGRPNIFNFVDTVNQDAGNILYQMTAINGAGYGISEIKEVSLPSSVPEKVTTVRVNVIDSTTVIANWTHGFASEVYNNQIYQIIIRKENDGSEIVFTTTVSPRRSKRELVQQQVVESGSDISDDALLNIVPAGNSKIKTITNLIPHTRYHIRIRTCLVNDSLLNSTIDDMSINETLDCNVGPSVQIRTASSPPSGLKAPKLSATSSSTVVVTWHKPSEPNGDLERYRIYRRTVDRHSLNGDEKLVYSSTDAHITTYTDGLKNKDLSPYTLYKYRVYVENEIGEEFSEWGEIRTKEDIPMGVSSPRVEPVSAFAVKVDWKEPSEPNGILASYRLEYQEVAADPTFQPPILTAITVSSRITEATFSGLLPFTTYSVRLVAINQGPLEGSSDWVHVTTLPAPPSEVADLTAEKMPDGRSLLLTWNEPALPNGEIQTYNLFEVGYEDAPLYTGLSRLFSMRRLSPYTNYTLVLQACTGRELCSRTPPKTFQTAETLPEEQSPPIVGFSNATAVIVTWSKPSRPNGRIISYQVIRKMMSKSHIQPSQRYKRSLADKQQLNTFAMWYPLQYSPELTFDDFGPIKTRMRRNVFSDDDVNEGDVIHDVIDPKGQSFNFSDSSVLPFTKYGYKIRTSTMAGYVDSTWVTAETYQAPPSGISPPEVFHPGDKSPTSLVVTWRLPEELNGMLQTFRIQRNNTTPLSFPASQFQYIDTDLMPFTIYSYTVSACTAGGCATSLPKTMRTYEEAPLFVDKPQVVALNATAIRASWRKPEITNGIISKYRLKVGHVIRYEGMDQSAVVNDLQPFRTYDVILEACTNSGCRDSEVMKVQTLEAAPSGMESPELHVTSPNSIEVIWQPPLYPNGVMTRYEVRRNGELVKYNDGDVTRYHDFGLTAGTQYTYTVTAFNKQGHVVSDPPTSQTTDPSTPSGLSPPTLVATSPSSVRVTWDEPLNPNGEIVNYTLFVRHVSKKDQKKFDFAGKVFTFQVRGLEYFQEYIFWVQACTLLGCTNSERNLQRTLESEPANQKPPRVTLPYRDQATLDVTWSPPGNKNGIIKLYQLYKRLVISTDSLDSVLLANVTGLTYTDHELLPYTQYQYKIVSSNSAGKAPSQWSTPIRTGESPPDGVPEPRFGDVTSRSVKVVCGDPKSANGIARYCHVWMRLNDSMEAMQRVSSGVGTEQTIRDLLPFTTYQFSLEVCTLEFLCTRGPAAVVTTLPAPPSGQEILQTSEIGPHGFTLMWSLPAKPNGKIIRYDIEMHLACPPSHQPYPQECAIGPSSIVYSGAVQRTIVGNLLPYTRYALRVTSFNEYGKSESDWTTVVTAISPPKYVHPFTASGNISFIEIRWPMSFQLNGNLFKYELTDKGRVIYSGYETNYLFRRTASIEHKFRVTAYTKAGRSNSPVLVYDTSKNNNYGDLIVPNDFQSNANDSSNPDVSTAQIPIYKNTWFVIAMAIVVMAMLLLLAWFALRRMGGSQNFGHQRSSLKMHGRMTPPRGNLMLGMTPLPPYRSDGSIYNYSVHSCPVESKRHPQSHLNRSYSADSLHKGAHLVGQDVSFDDDFLRANDQWERVSSFDDQDAYARRLSRAGDSGMISNFADPDFDPYSTPKQLLTLVDTHL